MSPKRKAPARNPAEPHAPEWELHCADALRVAEQNPDRRFRLIYVDPPFFSGRSYENRLGEGGFEDSFGGNMEDYLAFLAPRLKALYGLLEKDGSLLIHLDWHAVHYVKVLCDSLFGAERFQNEIIWSYNSGGGSKKRYGRKHDTILWYAKSADVFFNTDAARVPYSAIIAAKRAHLFNESGKVSGDVLQIPRPPNHAAEWTGWPTQKPLELLRFLVRCHSRPGDWVADFFCGSGTTLVAAVGEGRRAFGCDENPAAIQTARQRLET